MAANGQWQKTNGACVLRSLLTAPKHDCVCVCVCAPKNSVLTPVKMR